MTKLARHRAPASDARTRKMRAVLAACRRLGIDQDARRELQRDVTGQLSMASMDEAELGRLLDHLNRDWRGTNPARPHVAKIKALWWSLYWIGAIDEPADHALSAFVKRQTGIAALRFLDHRNAFSVIEALKGWLAREGVAWPAEGEDRGTAERRAVLAAIRRKLESAGRTVIIDVTHPAQLDDAIRALGKQWRAARP